MRRNSLRFCLCFLIALLAPFVHADTGWIEVKTQHFRVVTDAGEKNGREIAERFEQMRAAFGLIFRRKTLNEPVPLTIIAFRNAEEIRQYSPLFQGKVVELSGFFIPGRDENFVAVDLSHDASWETVEHEYAHDLLNANFMATAPWFDEGFAEFFSSLRLSGGVAEIGAGILEAPALFQGRKLGLQELFEVEHHSETYNRNGQRRGMFYVESWLVVHYLLDTGLATKDSRYFELRNNQQMPVAQAVQEAFGVTLPEMEKAVLDYLRAKKVAVRYFSLKEQAISSDVTVRTLDSLEARAQLADLHLHSPDYQAAAIKEFEAIITENPNQAEAQRGLGYAYLRQQNFPKATEHLQAAARLGSKDAKVYYYMARLLHQENPAALTSAQVMANLRHAIELDPQCADAYAMLGVSLMDSKTSPAEAESSLARAVELAPRNDLYRYNYGLALLDQQQIDKGKQMLGMVLHSSDPNLAEEASQALKYVNERDNYDRRNTKIAEASVDQPSFRQEAPAPAQTASTFPEPSAPVKPVAAQYLQGTLVSVDCSSPPVAVLTVSAGNKTWKLVVDDTDHVVVIGADNFSCSWTQKKVAFNYAPSAPNEGKVISLELQ